MSKWMEQSYTYEALAARYGNFFVPALVIRLPEQDVELTAVEAGLTAAEIVLSTEKPGSASLTFAGCWNAEQSAFEDRIKNNFQPGALLEVRAGYLSDTTLVFRGVISAVTARVGELPSYTVTGMDARWLMTQNYRMQIHKADTWSDIVAVILQDYKGICSLEADESEEQIGAALQHGNDYEFIMNTIIRDRLADRCFFLSGETAYFIREGSYSEPVLTLKRGEGLRDFVRKAVFLNKEIILYPGEYGQDGVSVMAAGRQQAAADCLPDQKQPWNARLSEQAGCMSSHARVLAARLQQQAEEVQGVCVGLPELMPGRYLAISGADPDYDGNYMLSQVVHQFDGSGFETRFTGKGDR